jgi:hypothetical protein
MLEQSVSFPRFGKITSEKKFLKDKYRVQKRLKRLPGGPLNVLEIAQNNLQEIPEELQDYLVNNEVCKLVLDNNLFAERVVINNGKIEKLSLRNNTPPLHLGLSNLSESLKELDLRGSECNLFDLKDILPHLTTFKCTLSKSLTPKQIKKTMHYLLRNLPKKMDTLCVENAACTVRMNGSENIRVIEMPDTTLYYDTWGVNKLIVRELIISNIAAYDFSTIKYLECSSLNTLCPEWLTNLEHLKLRGIAQIGTLEFDRFMFLKTLVIDNFKGTHIKIKNLPSLRNVTIEDCRGLYEVFLENPNGYLDQLCIQRTSADTIYVKVRVEQMRISENYNLLNLNNQNDQAWKLLRSCELIQCNNLSFWQDTLEMPHLESLVISGKVVANLNCPKLERLYFRSSYLDTSCMFENYKHIKLIHFKKCVFGSTELINRLLHTPDINCVFVSCTIINNQIIRVINPEAGYRMYNSPQIQVSTTDSYQIQTKSRLCRPRTWCAPPRIRRDQSVC